jgi:hypothetical protein
MTTPESYKIISRLKSAFSFNRFDDEGVLEEYQHFLVKYSFRIINAAIDALIESDSQRVPPISAIIKTVKEFSKPATTIVSNPEYCAICDNKGFILMTEMESKLDDKPYQYVLHCTCQVGMSQAYEGKNCKDHKTTYRVPCVTEFFDEYNVEKMKRLTASEKTDIKRQLAKIGFNVPEARLWDKGDAWEGEDT